VILTDSGSRPYDVSNDVMKSAILKISNDISGTSCVILGANVSSERTIHNHLPACIPISCYSSEFIYCYIH